jgi:hypothetical protein
MSSTGFLIPIPDLLDQNEVEKEGIMMNKYFEITNSIG